MSEPPTPERNPPDWTEIKTIFGAACDLPAEDRHRYLDAACAGRPHLRREVEALLASDDGTGVLERPLLADAAIAPEDLERPPRPSLLDERVGGCRLIRVLAEGGMGVVFEAEQENPRRRVALKVMRWGPGSDALLRRFAFEAEVMAQLHHPGIAQIHEAGTHVATDGHRVPYFVMELVEDAKTLTEYAAGLDLDARLELFAEVADIVHHGHQRGVIHRDLKPANILVDTSGRPKVIDFGIARATAADLAVATFATETGQIVGTPQYMSPEQCRGTSRAIDVRTDVYSLGVILCELVCGQPPYDLGQLGILDAVRVVIESSPRRPSTVRAGTHADLDTIVLHALEKEPARRYSSAAELAEEIRRFRRREPIRARPPSVSYQLRLFARRHRLLVAGAALVLLALTAATVVSTVFWLEADRRREEAESATGRERERAVTESAARERAERLFDEGRELATWVLFSFNQRLQHLPGSVEARGALADRCRAYLEGLAQDAAGNASLELDLARAWVQLGNILGHPRFSNLGRSKEARAAYERALARYAALGSREAVREEIAEARNHYGDVLHRAGERSLALAEWRVVLEEARRTEEPVSARSLLIRSEAARRIASEGIAAGDASGARALFEESITSAASARTIDAGNLDARRSLARTHAELGSHLLRAGDREAGVEHLRAYAELVGDTPLWEGTEERRAAATRSILLGDLAWESGDIAASLACYRDAVRSDEGLHAASPEDDAVRRSLALGHERVGQALQALSRHEEAVASFARELEILRDIVETSPTDRNARRQTAVAEGLAAQSLLALDRPRDAIAALGRSVEAQERLLAELPDLVESHHDLSVTLAHLANIHRALAAGAVAPRVAREHWRTAEETYLRYREVIRVMDERGLRPSVETVTLETIDAVIAGVRRELAALGEDDAEAR